MRNRIILLLLVAAVWTCQSLQAQVTMGGGTPPRAGAILDLNSTNKGGLLLSNVDITDLEKIPTGTNVFPGITAGVDDDDNELLTGAVVYSYNAVNTGVYVWDGHRWISFCDHCPPQPEGITGSTATCAGTTGLIYSVTNPVAGLTYTWSVSGTGWSINGANTGNSITITAGTGNGSVTVTPSNASCDGTSLTTPVTVSAVSAAPSDQTFTLYVGHGKTLATLGATGTGLKWYDAETEGLELDAATTTITDTGGSTLTYYISQTISGKCESATRALVTVTVKVNPGTLPTLTGSGTFTGKTCFDVAYNNSGGVCGELAGRTRYEFAPDPAPNTKASELYTFAPTGTPTGVYFDYVNLDGSNPVIESIEDNLDNTVTVTFYRNLDVSARDVQRAYAYQAELYVIYTSASIQYMKKLTLGVADCWCCPGVVIRNSQGGEHTGPNPKDIPDYTTYAQLLSDYGFSKTGKDLCVYYRDVYSPQVWSIAIENCANGNFVDVADRSLGGWRMPNIAELGQMSTAATGGAPKFNALTSATGADVRTEDMQSIDYWSITQLGGSHNYAWSYLYTGLYTPPAGAGRYVRCVRTVD